MEKVYTSSDYSSQLLSQMSELWRVNKYCDAVLNLQDERFKLHKLVLMAACPNILRCLAHTEENNVFEFYLPDDIEKSAVRLIVNYLYIGSIQLNMANVYGIQKLAKQLRLSTLSQFCHDFLSLLESETLSQSLLQPGIRQENIPKQESTEVEKVVDPNAVDALNKSANATLAKINNGTLSMPQSTDGFEQLPLASKSIKTELDASINPTLEEAVSKNQEKTITIEPLPVNNILQVSKSDNSITTASATDSAILEQHLGNDRLESPPVSHQTSSMGTKDPQLNSCQASTITSLTPVLSTVACNPSTLKSRGEEGDDIDLIMTAEDEDFEDSDNEWVPQGDESSDSNYCPESSPDRSTMTKRKMSMKGPKVKRSKKDAPLTATKKKIGGDKLPLASKSIKTELDASISPTLEEAISKNQEKTITIEPLPVNNILQVSKSDNSITTASATDSATLKQHLGSDRLESPPASHQTSSMGTKDPQLNSCQASTITSLTPVLSTVACNPSTSQSHGEEGDDIDLIMTAADEDFEDSDNEWVPQGDESSDSDYCPESSPDRSTKTKRRMSMKGPKAKRSKKDVPLTATKKKIGGDKITPADIKKIGDSRKISMSSDSAEHLSRVHTADKPNRLFVSDKSYAASECPGAGESDHVTDQADILNITETQLGGCARKNGSFKTTPESVTKSKRARCTEYPSSAGLCTRKRTANKLKSTKYTQDRVNEKRTQANKGRSIDTDSVSGNEDKTTQMEHKLKIVEHAEIHGVKSAAELHNITEDIVEDWIMLKNHFTKKTRVEKKLALTPKYKKLIKMGEHTDLEDTVINWLVETQYTPGMADDVTIIQKKSVEIAEEIGKPDVNIGNNWVKQMLEKYIRNIKTDKTNATLNIFNFELRQKVRDYAKKNGVKTAAEHFNLPQETVACWKKNRNQKDAPDTKSTRNRYKFNFKLDAVKCAEQVGNMGAARVYGVSEKNIRDWRKQKEHLIKYEENRLGIKRSVTRPYSLIESLLENWILSEKRKMTVEEIRAKALLFAEQTNSPEFKASYTWCIRFLKLHNMREHVK